MKVRLHGPERTAREDRDLVKRAVGKEPKGHHLAIGLGESGHGATDGLVALATNGQAFGVDRPVGPEPGHGILAAVDRGAR